MLAAAQVIDAIAARITGLTIGASVYTSRAWPLAEKDLPAWRVIAHDEDVEPMSIHTPWVDQHQLQVELHGFVQATQDVDDAMHALASEALTALFNVPLVPDALTPIVAKNPMTLRRIERTLAKEGEATLGLVLITLRAIFQTASTNPDTLL